MIEEKYIRSQSICQFFNFSDEDEKLSFYSNRMALPHVCVKLTRYKKVLIYRDQLAQNNEVI